MLTYKRIREIRSKKISGKNTIFHSTDMHQLKNKFQYWDSINTDANKIYSSLLNEFCTTSFSSKSSRMDVVSSINYSILYFLSNESINNINNDERIIENGLYFDIKDNLDDIYNYNRIKDNLIRLKRNFNIILKEDTVDDLVGSIIEKYVNMDSKKLLSIVIESLYMHYTFNSRDDHISENELIHQIIREFILKTDITVEEICDVLVNCNVLFDIDPVIENLDISGYIESYEYNPHMIRKDINNYLCNEMKEYKSILYITEQNMYDIINEKKDSIKDEIDMFKKYSEDNKKLSSNVLKRIFWHLNAKPIDEILDDSETYEITRLSNYKLNMVLFGAIGSIIELIVGNIIRKHASIDQCKTYIRKTKKEKEKAEEMLKNTKSSEEKKVLKLYIAKLDEAIIKVEKYMIKINKKSLLDVETTDSKKSLIKKQRMVRDRVKKVQGTEKIVKAYDKSIDKMEKDLKENVIIDEKVKDKLSSIRDSIKKLELSETKTIKDLKSMMNKIYTKPLDDIILDTPHILGCIRRIFIIGGSFFINPILGVVVGLTDNYISNSINREQSEVYMKQLQRELEKAEKDLDKASTEEKKERIKSYIETLNNSISKIENYKDNLKSEKEKDEELDSEDESLYDELALDDTLSKYPLLFEKFKQDMNIGVCIDENALISELMARVLVFSEEIQRIYQSNESVNIYDSVLLESKILNTLKLSGEKFKSSIKKLPSKEKAMANKLDNMIDKLTVDMQNALSNKKREDIIKGRVLPSTSRIIKLALGIGIGFALNPILGIIGALGSIAVSKKTSAREKQFILDEIEIYIKITEKKLNQAEMNGDDKSMEDLYKSLMKLKREKQRIKLGMRDYYQGRR